VRKVELASRPEKREHSRWFGIHPGIAVEAQFEGFEVCQTVRRGEAAVA